MNASPAPTVSTTSTTTGATSKLPARRGDDSRPRSPRVTTTTAGPRLEPLRGDFLDLGPGREPGQVLVARLDDVGEPDEPLHLGGRAEAAAPISAGRTLGSYETVHGCRAPTPAQPGTFLPPGGRSAPIDPVWACPLPGGQRSVGPGGVPAQVEDVGRRAVGPIRASALDVGRADSEGHRAG